MTTLYDVIIVLGGGVDEKGEIPPNVALRVKESARLLRKGVAPRIIMSGKWGYTATYTPPKTEAAAMKQVAVAEGAPSDAVLLEESSADTAGNAYFCKTLFLRPNNWKRVLVLTADHHAKRAEYLFKKVLGPEYPFEMRPVATVMDAATRIQKEERHERSLKIAQEWLDGIADGDDVAIWKLMSTKHPAYSANPEISKEELAKKLVDPQ